MRMKASDVAHETREEARRLVDAIRARYRIDIPEIAERARVSPSTIYRWFDDSFTHSPGATTIRKIATAFNMLAAPAGAAGGLAAPEVQLLSMDQLPKGLQLGNSEDCWLVQSRVLDLAGYMPGDLLIVDHSVQPVPGDAVVAVLHEFGAKGPEHRLRLFRAPYLMAKTTDPAVDEEPFYVDGRRVAIMGVVTKTLRIRQAIVQSHAA